MSIQDNINALKRERKELRTEYDYKIQKLTEAIDALEKFNMGSVKTHTDKTANNALKQRISWKNEITALFDKKDIWSIGEIYDMLASKGYKLHPVRSKGSISTTLGRMKDEGTIDKTDVGTYRKKVVEATDNTNDVDTKTTQERAHIQL